MATHTEPQRLFFAVAARGTEGALRDELRELGAPLVKATRGGVHLGGDFADAMRVCLHSRIAVRVLEKVADFAAADARSLYAGARQAPWERFLDRSRTLAVRANLRDSALTHSTFVSLKVKDAIVDRLRDRQGARPDVDRRDPDLLVSVHLVKDRAELFADLSGEPLHCRGYRIEAGEAPLKETLAAAILRLCGWDRNRFLVDPMCGSGTLIIEAAMLGQGVAPGLGRDRFGFERWACHDERRKLQIAALREMARGMQETSPPTASLLGLDRDRKVLQVARANARRAGVKARFAPGEIRDLRLPQGPGFVVTNPPYGVRVPGGASLYTDMARAFRRLSGFRVCAIVADRKLPDAMKLQPAIEHELWNGDIECRLFCWDVP